MSPFLQSQDIGILIQFYTYYKLFAAMNLKTV